MATRLYSHLLGSPEDHDMSLNIIVTREPMMQYTVDLLNNLCLKKGVKISIAFSKPEKDFQDFFEQYFVSTLPHVLRYKMYCGFIPWVVVQHPSTGDKMPVLLPIGSFSWSIRTKQQFTQDHSGNTSERGSKRKNKRSRNHGYNFNNGASHTDEDRDNYNVNLEHNCASEYVVESTGDMSVNSADIHVINLFDPMLLSCHSSSNSSMGGRPFHNGQAQFSPLYVSLQKYMAFDIAQQRRFYADDWNTTARLFTTKTPPSVQNERAGRDEIPYGTTRFQQAQMPEGFFTYDNMKLQFQNTADIVRDALEQTGGRGSEHVPSVYSLPAHYNLVQQPELKPLMDIDMLDRQYKSSIAQSLGVPMNLVLQDVQTSAQVSSDDLPYMSEMVKNTCGSLTTLMGKVLLHMYSIVYHNDAAIKNGPFAASRVRFKFATDELYSEDMKYREDEMVKLQKASTDSGGKAKTGKAAGSSGK